MLAHGGKLFRPCVDGGVLEHMRRDGREHVRQTDYVVEMGMSQKNVEVISLQVVAEADDAAARVEHDTDLRQQQASGLPRGGRIVAAGA
jgi:hypothetical protein